MNYAIWLGILLCVCQSAIFSGSNLAFFSLSRLRLEAEARSGNRAAARILVLRRDSNFLLTTILLGNVGINVLLTLLSNSIMAGVTAFLFSTLVITFAGEIIPQAYFSRYSMTMASLMSPVLRIYQFLLYPLAKPSAWMLDRLLGKERVVYLKERQLRGIIEEHIGSNHAEINFFEGRGALNFLEIDDIAIGNEGRIVDPRSVVSVASQSGKLQLPHVAEQHDDFVRDVDASGHKWVILTDLSGQPQLVLDADSYLRAIMRDARVVDPYVHCHRPIIVRDANQPLGHAILALIDGKDIDANLAIEKDIILLWSPSGNRIITGADVLARLLHGVEPGDQVRVREGAGLLAR